MATYCIEYKERSVGYFWVDAESEKEALVEFDRRAEEGEFEDGFARMEVEECSAVATLCEEGESE